MENHFAVINMHRDKNQSCNHVHGCYQFIMLRPIHSTYWRLSLYLVSGTVAHTIKRATALNVFTALKKSIERSSGFLVRHVAQQTHYVSHTLF